MDLSILKNPIILAALAGSVLVTSIVTYNVTAPADDSCAELLAMKKAEKEAMREAMKPLEGLNPDRRGEGLNWHKSIRE